MSVILAGAAAGLYAATVVGLHRWNVRRLRSLAGGFRVLERIDWQALVQGLLPRPPANTAIDPAIPERLPSGELTPASLRRFAAPQDEEKRAVLLQVVAGGAGDWRARAEKAGFSGAEVQWLGLIARVHTDPLATLAALEAKTAGTAEEAYLREYLRITRTVNVLNLELVVFAAKRRLTLALSRFGDQPCLYFARALASSRIGLNRAAIDDIARAVYFSHSAPFYVNAVLEAPYISEARPALTYQCRQALDAATAPGER